MAIIPWYDDKGVGVIARRTPAGDFLFSYITAGTYDFLGSHFNPSIHPKDWGEEGLSNLSNYIRITGFGGRKEPLNLDVDNETLELLQTILPRMWALEKSGIHSTGDIWEEHHYSSHWSAVLNVWNEYWTNGDIHMARGVLEEMEKGARGEDNDFEFGKRDSEGNLIKSNWFNIISTPNF